MSLSWIDLLNFLKIVFKKLSSALYLFMECVTILSQGKRYMLTEQGTLYLVLFCIAFTLLSVIYFTWRILKRLLLTKPSSPTEPSSRSIATQAVDSSSRAQTRFPFRTQEEWDKTIQSWKAPVKGKNFDVSKVTKRR